ncbi:MAG: DsbA family oxidoreductase [Succinivibrionaceae bacterium]|nr:DsbA family oxidoreductase [Succinivibrionaceae bacterium]
MEIFYWSDYACPFCWIGETRLKKALAQMPGGSEIRLVMKAFELDPYANQLCLGDTPARFARKYGLSHGEARKRVEHISALGEAEGLDLQYAKTRFTSTRDAHRLTKYAQSLEDFSLADRLSEELYRAYFSRGLELADHDALVEIAESCGLDAARVRQILSSDEFRAEVLSDEREANENGIRAVPCFVIGSLALQGACGSHDMLRFLHAAMEDATERKTVAGEDGCGPDGC